MKRTLAPTGCSLQYFLQRVALAIIATLLCTGCHTYSFKVAPNRLAEIREKREGTLSVKQFADKREDKTKIGEMKGGFGNKLGDIVSEEKLETSLTRIFTERLVSAGYKVSSGAPITMEGEVIEFSVSAGGFTQGARQKIRLRLRNREGEILWEHAFKGEDGGMLNGAGSVRKSMNIALERMLADVTEEFTSEFFFQNVNKGKSSK